MRIAFLTFAIIVSLNLQAQQPIKVDYSETKLYSFLTIRHGYLLDLRTNKNVIQIYGAWGESKWYKQNDSVFLIDFYADVIPRTENQIIVKYRLEIYSDSFNLKRNTKYIGYPILTKDQLNEIKTKQKEPCESTLWIRKSTHGPFEVNNAERYLAFLQWTAIAIMNGHDEFIEIYNSLANKNCCGAQCNEAYYETQYVLSLFELETYEIANGIKRLRKKY
jgi:hypothetical protein